MFAFLTRMCMCVSREDLVAELPTSPRRLEVIYEEPWPTLPLLAQLAEGDRRSYRISFQRGDSFGQRLDGTDEDRRELPIIEGQRCPLANDVAPAAR